MDWSFLEESGTFLMKVKMYPYFDIAHFILMCLVAREDINQHQTATSPNFSKKHPLACWTSSMLLCFGGGILAHFLLGEPVLEDFKNPQMLAVASIVWYLVFYCPFDLFYKIVKFLPIKICLCALKEIQRTRKIYEGVNHVSHVYPNGYIIIVIIASIKGAGSGFMNIIDRFIRGVWIPNTNELLNPTFATKGCFLSAILFLLERKSIINFPRSLLFLFIVIFFIYVKIISLFFKSFDPFVPFENLFSAFFFGGIIDAFKKANSSARNGKESTTADNLNANANKLITSSLNDTDSKSKDNKKKE